MIMICTIMGVPRITVIYSFATASSTLISFSFVERAVTRITAIMTPMMIPITTANREISRVMRSPLRYAR